MPTGAEQAAVIRGLIAQGQYSEAYSYAADQLSADSSWDPNVVSWLEYAAAINGDQPNFSKDYVFTSNAQIVPKRSSLISRYRTDSRMRY